MAPLLRAAYVRMQKNGYPAVRLGGKVTLVHRLVWFLKRGDIPAGKVIDHIDGNPLNALVSNLRLVGQSENGRNRKKRNKSNTSGFNGVSTTRNKRNPWRAYVKLMYQQIGLGVFPTAEDAAIAYDEYVWKRWKKYAYLNFPKNVVNGVYQNGGRNGKKDRQTH